VTIEAEQDARKVKLDEAAVWEKAQTAELVMATKGRSKILEWSPSADNKAEILNEIVGRSGNLRAPTLLIEGKLIVGFNQGLYETLF